MIKIKYVESCGTQHEVEAESGQSVMEVALANNLPGIDADCGGQCACGTCHVYIDASWLAKVPAAGAEEVEMLNFAEGSGPTSRLACQVKLESSHDGLVVRMPQSQH